MPQEEAPAPFPCEVLILTARPAEYQAISRYLLQPQEIVHTQGTVYQRGRFVSAQSVWYIAVAEVSGNGPGAAAETERALAFFHPECAFFVGTAGGLKDVQIGDVVVATKVYGYESGKSAQSFETRPELWHADYRLEQRARAEARMTDWTALLGIARPDPAPRVYIAPIAAGEKVIASQRSPLLDFLRAAYGDALAIEMESHGFSQAVHANQSVRSLVVRGIANRIDQKEHADVSAHDLAARHAAAFVFHLLTKLRFSQNQEPLFANRPADDQGADDALHVSPAHCLVWNVPLASNPFFTGREQELHSLYEHLHQRHTVAVGQIQSISGLGGVGKTQLVLEYAYRHRNEYTYVLWARADSVESLNASYAACAADLNLPEQHAREQDVVVQAVKAWFQKHDSWLFILDGADEPDALVSFLPASSHGHLLLTTRAADLTSLGLGIAHALAMDALPVEQSVSFLLQRANLLALHASVDEASPQDRFCASRIAQELGNLPLALDQAGAYLAATGTGLSPYLSLYQQHRPELLKERRNLMYPDSVATTWNLSFAWVEQKNPAAAELLRACALMAFDTIPEEVLTQGAAFLGPVLSPVAADAYQLSKAIETLRAYSLVQRNARERTLTVHRLVQAVLQDVMEGAEQRCWADRVLQAVNAAFPEAERRNWSQCERLLPQALSASILIERYQLRSAEAGRLLYQTALYLQDRPRQTQAEPFSQLAFQPRDVQQYPDITRTLNSLAHPYQRQGTSIGVEPLHQHAWLVLEQQLGLEYADVASPLSGLAELYREQGKYAQAEALYQQALYVREQHLGSEHPDVAFPLGRLADLYREQALYERARPLYERALRIWELQLGSAHPLVAFLFNNLANLCYAAGQYDQAGQLYRRALHIWESQQESEHSFQKSIHTTRANYASLLQDTGRDQEAKDVEHT